MKRKLKSKVKITLYLLFLIVLLCAFFFEIKYSSNVLENKDITYTKRSTFNYITYLKDNNHYESKYLKNEYNFVASLIDYFNIDYNYNYTLSEKIKYELTYKIDAILEVYDSDNDAKPIEKREFKILDEKKLSGNSQIIKVDIFKQKIDYETYNKIVQNWKKEISPNAKLTILVKVKWDGKTKKLNKKLKDNTVIDFIIPISQKTIDIKSPKNIDETGVIKSKAKIPLWYILIICSTILLFAIEFIYMLIYIISLSNKKSKYEQKVNKILREFDRVITEANGEFVKDPDENYIEVKDFMELLDVHDNINEPIIYYKNNENLSVFVIKNGHDTYYSAIKRSDYDD